MGGRSWTFDLDESRAWDSPIRRAIRNSDAGIANFVTQARQLHGVRRQLAWVVQPAFKYVWSARRGWLKSRAGKSPILTLTDTIFPSTNLSIHAVTAKERAWFTSRIMLFNKVRLSLRKENGEKNDPPRVKPLDLEMICSPGVACSKWGKKASSVVLDTNTRAIIMLCLFGNYVTSIFGIFHDLRDADNAFMVFNGRVQT